MQNYAGVFFQKRPTLKPKHQRDIGRIIALTKCVALLNLWWRERQGATIIASDEDIDEAFKIWDKIAEENKQKTETKVEKISKALRFDFSKSQTDIAAEAPQAPGPDEKKRVRPGDKVKFS